MTEVLPIISVAISINKVTKEPTITLPWDPFVVYFENSDDAPEINLDFRDLPSFVEYLKGIEDLAVTIKTSALFTDYIKAEKALTGKDAYLIATTSKGLDWDSVQTMIHDQASAGLNSVFHEELDPRVRTHSQNMTVAARAQADKNRSAQRS